MTSDPVTLGEIAHHMKMAGIQMLQVGCKNCDRFGQYRIDDLIDRHGADMGLPEFRRLVSRDCQNDPCGVCYPQIASTYRDEVI